MLPKTISFDKHYANKLPKIHNSQMKTLYYRFRYHCP